MITFILVTFVLGYLAIALEHSLHLNKAVPALFIAVLIWTGVSRITEAHVIEEELLHHVSDVAQITFFLWGAMTIVELIASHDGFHLITNRIKVRNKFLLLIIVSFLTFFLSALLDNLTTAIVMISLTRKILQNPKDRLYFAGMVIIAANAGGAWSPIGDVTTTMLWMGKQITDIGIVTSLFVPSIVALVVPLAVMGFRLRGEVEFQSNFETRDSTITPTEQKLVLILGLVALISVPIFKKVTHLPPFLGMLGALSWIWLITEFIHRNKDAETKKSTTIGAMLTKIDTPTLLFFVGILLAVAGLQTAGILSVGAQWADVHIPNKATFLAGIGAISSIIDNIPVVKAVQAMYPLTTYPTDSPFWSFLAYTAGTGGSMLVIGSAAGVAAMAIEKKLSFGWYLKHITPYAVISYMAGGLLFLLFNHL